MSNVQTAAQFRNMAPYEAAAFTDALAGPVEYTQDRYEQAGDGMSLGITATFAATGTAVKASAGKVYSLVIKSPSGASNGVNVSLYNVAAAGVTLGTTVPRLWAFCPATETIVVPVHAAGSANIFTTAITVCCTAGTSLTAAAAAADVPTVVVKYA